MIGCDLPTMTYKEFMSQAFDEPPTPSLEVEIVDPCVPRKNAIPDPAANLSAIQRRVAFMYMAEASITAIAAACDTSSVQVEYILERPAVQRFIRSATALCAVELRPVMQKVNEAIEQKAERAFEISHTVMEDMFSRRQDVKAATLAVSTAQDIMNRAGLAPTKKVDVRSASLRVNAEAPISQALGDAVLKVVKEMRE